MTDKNGQNLSPHWHYLAKSIDHCTEKLHYFSNSSNLYSFAILHSSWCLKAALHQQHLVFCCNTGHSTVESRADVWKWCNASSWQLFYVFLSQVFLCQLFFVLSQVFLWQLFYVFLSQVFLWQLFYVFPKLFSLTQTFNFYEIFSASNLNLSI